jgi:hypothetical protein
MLKFNSDIPPVFFADVLCHKYLNYDPSSHTEYCRKYINNINVFKFNKFNALPAK